VQELKDASSHFLNHRTADPGPRRVEDRGHDQAVEPGHTARPTLHWQRGYGAFSFWERDARLVAGYIPTQQERHVRDRWLPFDILAPDPRAAVASINDALEDEAILINEWEYAGDEARSWQGTRTDRS
jgi:hypothetical protein